MAASTIKTEISSAPLNEVMLAMDVVDTLRHRQDLVIRELDGEKRKARLVERLRTIYLDQGIDVPEHILLEGVAALEEDRFTYEPTGNGLRRKLARLYVSRSKWGKWFLGLFGALIVGFGAYFIAYIPYQASQKEAARVELMEDMPRQMQAVYQAIFDETKVQSPVNEAKALLARGQTASKEENREDAQAALDGLIKIRDILRQVYTLRVVNRNGVQSGFWTFPELNQDATNYYIVIEALDGNGDPLALDIENQETGVSEEVELWGIKVPKNVYDSVSSDKRDDGIIQRNVVGQKDFGYPEVSYLIPVSGGAVTRW